MLPPKICLACINYKERLKKWSLATISQIFRVVPMLQWLGPGSRAFSLWLLHVFPFVCFTRELYFYRQQLGYLSLWTRELPRSFFISPPLLEKSCYSEDMVDILLCMCTEIIWSKGIGENAIQFTLTEWRDEIERILYWIDVYYERERETDNNLKLIYGTNFKFP